MRRYEVIPVVNLAERGAVTAADPLMQENGRGDRIRTCDPHTPSVMRYQAALRPDRGTVRRVPPIPERGL